MSRLLDPSELGESPSVPGLTTAQAAERLKAEGPNRLPRAKSVSPWRQLLAQMTHFFAAMLWVAGGLAIVAGMPQLGFAIFLVIVVNGLFAFTQEHRAERASEALRDLLPRQASAVRDGLPVTVDATELVREDLVVLRPGDRVSADMKVVEAHSLLLDLSTLTGESEPQAVNTDDAIWAGTFVVEGEGRGVVTHTGRATRLGGIAVLTREGTRPRSPLARELDRLVRTITFIALGVGVGFFLIALAVGTSASDGFLFAIGVTVALVPEGLLPTVTLSLAAGAQQMARRNALVRRLEAVESLGSTTFICTDKTGTLTSNEMAVVQAWTPLGTAVITGSGYEPTGTVEASDEVRVALWELAVAGVHCSDGRSVLENGRWRAEGDPMEAAIDVLARRLGVPDDERRAPIGRRFAFDPRRRRMSLVAGDRLVVKGAPDAVLPRCSNARGAAEALDVMAERGLRVLAVAGRPTAEVPDGASADEAESGLILLGLMGLEDPPRPSAAAAVEACRRAGIRLAMITGDHPATALAIGREVGLVTERSSSVGEVILGHELPDDEELLGALLDRDGIIVARVTPENKLRIAKALRKRGHVVAMTGDGVNDGPALQAADIGVAMGRSGTDVAREAADLVLLDDDFGTIYAAVEQGRATFSNIRRFLTYHLTDNVAELTPFVVWALSGGRFPLAIGVVQILFLDIGTDLLPALALGAEQPTHHLMQRPPHGRRLLDRSVGQRAFGVLGPTEALVEMSAFVVSLWVSGWRPGHAFPSGAPLLTASGAAFTAVVLGQFANAFACRSTARPAWSIGRPVNKLLIGAVIIELVMLLGFLFIGPVASVLEHASPSVAGWAVASLAIPAVLGTDAAAKTWRQHRGAQR